MLKIFKKKKITLNKYKYKITYKNKNVTEGILEVTDMNRVYEIFCKNTFHHIDNDNKAVYYNVDEIQEIYVEKVEEK